MRGLNNLAALPAVESLGLGKAMSLSSKKRVAIALSFLISVIASLYHIAPVSYSGIWQRASITSIVATILLSLYAHLRYYIFTKEPLTRHSGGWKVFGALLFSLVIVIGQSLNVSHSLIGFYNSPKHVIMFVVRVAGLALIAYPTIGILFDFIDRLRANSKTFDARPSLFGVKLGAPHYFVFIFLCWLVYLLIFFPGAIPTDTSRQMAQFIGDGSIPLNNHFPFLVTLIYTPLYQLGMIITSDGVASMAILSLFQILVGSTICSLVVSWTTQLGSSKWIWAGSLIFCGLFPLFPSHAVTISKDYLYACVVVLLALQLVLIVKLGDAKPPVIASVPAVLLCCILVCLTRNNGMFFAVPALLVAGLLTKRKRYIASTVAVLVIPLSWKSLFLPAMGVAPSEKREALSAPIQIIVRGYADGLEFSEEETQVLSRSLYHSPESLGKAYDPIIADPTKAILIEDDSLSSLDIIAIALRVTVTDPGNSISALLNTTLGFWCPFASSSYWASEYAPYYTGTNVEYAALGTWFAGSDWVDAWSVDHATEIAVLYRITSLPIVGCLYSTGFYIWLIVFIALYSFSTKSRRRLTISLLVPFALLFATLIAGPYTSMRYALPFIYALPLFLWVLCSPTIVKRLEVE